MESGDSPTSDETKQHNDVQVGCIEAIPSPTPSSSGFMPFTELLGSGNARRHRVHRMRNLKRRSSVENFGRFGLLTPALVLQPLANRGDALTQQFQDLQGDHKELKLAAAHIEDALTGRGKYGKARSFFKSKRAQRCFSILSNSWFQKLIILNILLHSLLISWEPPTCNLDSLHPIIVVLNLLCLLVYCFDLLVHITFLNWRVFWSSHGEERYWNGIRFCLVSCFIMDFVILICSWATGKYVPQVFRCLRLSMLLCKSKNIRHIFDVLKTIGVRLIKVFSVYLVFIFFFACIGIHIFMNEYECNGDPSNKNSTTMHHGKRTECFITSKEIIYKGAFNNVLDAMIRLFVLLSTENYPEIMLPSLRVHYLYFAFFGIFIFVGVFFLTAILLAIIVDSYWEFAKKSVKEERARERAELAKAWNLLDPLGHGTMSVDDEKFAELFHILKPRNSEEENKLLIRMLDANNDNEIDSFEWTTTLSQVLNNEFEKDGIAETDEDVISSPKWLQLVRELCCQITQSAFFSYSILVLINIHCFMFSLHWKDSSSTAVITIQGLKTIIISVFMFEVIIRCIALGQQILQPIEIIDSLLVVISFLFNILWYIKYPNPFWFRQYAALISGVAIFGRLLFNSTQLLKAVRIFLIIAPVMLDLILLLTILIYVLSTVGMELLYDKETNSEEYPSCGLGFRTFWCSCLTIFQILSTSNWHEIMNEVVGSTGSKWYMLFFVVSYILMTLIVMNVFVAIAIEAFNKLATQNARELKRQSSVRNEDNKTSTMLQYIGSFAEEIFRSSRVEGIASRRQSLGPGYKTTRSGSIAIPFGTVQLSRIPETNTQVEEAGQQEVEAAEDWSHLSVNQKREMILKRRMKKKKKARRSSSEQPTGLTNDQIFRVITAFRACRKEELDLSVGDEVVVTKQSDDWWKGRCRRGSGWFPASHVVTTLSRAVPEYRDKSKPQTGYGQVMNADHIAEGALFGNDNIVFQEEGEVGDLGPFRRDRTSSRGSYVEPSNRINASRPHSPAVKHPKMKLRKSRDWRKEILGDMTIMNADEMRELNNIMRAELRTPSATTRGEFSRTGLKKTSNVSVSSEDMLTRDHSFHKYFSKESLDSHGKTSISDEVHQDPLLLQPMLQVSLVGSPTPPPTPPARANSRDESSYLKVKAVKESKAAKYPQGTTKTGEMPEWMVRFVSKNNLVVGQDMKFIETDDPNDQSETDHPHVVPLNDDGLAAILTNNNRPERRILELETKTENLDENK